MIGKCIFSNFSFYFVLLRRPRKGIGTKRLIKKKQNETQFQNARLRIINVINQNPDEKGSDFCEDFFFFFFSKGLLRLWHGGKMGTCWAVEMGSPVGHGWLVAGMGSWVFLQTCEKLARSPKPRPEET